MSLVTVRIPTPLRGFTDGLGEVQASGGTVGAVLDELLARYPELRPRLLNEAGELRNFVNLFVGSESVTDLQGLATPITEGTTIAIVPAVAGGGP